MAHDLDPDTTAQRARDLLDKRIHSVRHLVTTRQAVTDLRAQLDTAERDDAAAYTAALRDGWTPDELKTLGLPEPAAKPRPRKPTKTATPPAT